MGSLIGHRIDYNGVERGSERPGAHTQHKLTRVPLPPPPPPGSILGCEFHAKNFQQQLKNFLHSVKNGDGCLLKGNLRRATELMRLLL